MIYYNIYIFCLSRIKWLPKALVQYCLLGAVQPGWSIASCKPVEHKYFCWSTSWWWSVPWNSGAIALDGKYLCPTDSQQNRTGYNTIQRRSAGVGVQSVGLPCVCEFSYTRSSQHRELNSVQSAAWLFNKDLWLWEVAI